MNIEKTAVRAKYLRWFDFAILMAYRKDDKHTNCVVNHAKKG